MTELISASLWWSLVIMMWACALGCVAGVIWGFVELARYIKGVFKPSNGYRRL